jgi:hypothetical protein
MNIDQLLEPSTYDSASPAHVTTSMRGGLILPAIHRQRNAEQHPYAKPLASAAPPHGALTNSQPFVAPGWHTSMSIEMESGRARSNQSNTKIITITDQQGRDVHIPTDVCVGSKAADKRRKRNASASARFRMRSKTIEDLKNQLHDARKQMESLTAERDYLKSIVERDNMRHSSPVVQAHRTVGLQTALVCR